MPINHCYKWALSLPQLFLFTLLLSGCGDIAIYDKHDHNLHGKKIKFNVEMVYVPIEELTEKTPNEMKKFEYSLIQKSYALKIHHIATTNYKSINTDMEFTVLKSYLNKVFSPIGDDIRMVVLKDENEIISVISISFLKKSNLDQSFYIEYVL